MSGSSELPPRPRSQRSERVWLWVGCVLLVLLVVLYRVSLPAAMPGVVHLYRATASLPLDPQTPARAVSLPHVLDDEAPAWWGRVDYVLPWP